MVGSALEKAQLEPHRESVVGLFQGQAEEFGGASQAVAEGVRVHAQACRGFGDVAHRFQPGEDRGDEVRSVLGVMSGHQGDTGVSQAWFVAEFVADAGQQEPCAHVVEGGDALVGSGRDTRAGEGAQRPLLPGGVGAGLESGPGADASLAAQFLAGVPKPAQLWAPIGAVVLVAPGAGAHPGVKPAVDKVPELWPEAVVTVVDETVAALAGAGRDVRAKPSASC